MDLIERLRRRVVCEPSYIEAPSSAEELPDEDCHEAAAELARLRAEVERFKAALIESYEDNLYASLHDGVTGNEGKWWPGGMSTAEWFCRQTGITRDPVFTKDELLARVPDIAIAMVARVTLAHEQ